MKLVNNKDAKYRNQFIDGIFVQSRIETVQGGISTTARIDNIVRT